MCIYECVSIVCWPTATFCSNFRSLIHISCSVAHFHTQTHTHMKYFEVSIFPVPKTCCEKGVKYLLVAYRTCHCNALYVYVLLTLFVVRFKQPLNWIITQTTPTNNLPSYSISTTTNNTPFTSTSMTKITFWYTIDYIRLTMLFWSNAGTAESIRKRLNIFSSHFIANCWWTNLNWLTFTFNIKSNRRKTNNEPGRFLSFLKKAWKWSEHSISWSLNLKY